MICHMTLFDQFCDLRGSDLIVTRVQLLTLARIGVLLAANVQGRPGGKGGVGHPPAVQPLIELELPKKRVCCA